MRFALLGGLLGATIVVGVFFLAGERPTSRDQAMGAGIRAMSTFPR
jgi:hypothetical protein